MQDRAPDRQPLHHPARQLGDGIVGARPHPDRLQHLVDARLGDAVQARVEAQVLAPRQLAVQQRLMAEEADPAAHRVAVVGQRAAEHANLAGVRAQQRGEHPQQRRLAGAVGPEHDERATGLERERDVAQRGALAIAASDAAQDDSWV